MEIKIEFADRKPNTNGGELWDYPVAELEYLFQTIKDGTRQDGATFIFYNDRLFEKEI